MSVVCSGELSSVSVLLEYTLYACLFLNLLRLAVSIQTSENVVMDYQMIDKALSTTKHYLKKWYLCDNACLQIIHFVHTNIPSAGVALNSKG